MEVNDTHIVWIDLETGGIDENLHQITQIAAIATTGPPAFEANALTFERKITLVPGRYTEEALQLQGYDAAVWEERSMPIVQALQELNVWLDPYCHTRTSKKSGRPYQVAHMAGHNVEFDGRFLRAACDRNKIWLRLTNWTGGRFDTLALAKWWFMKNGQYPEVYTLEHLCEVFNIALDPHDAMDDVGATVELARRLMK